MISTGGFWGSDSGFGRALTAIGAAMNNKCAAEGGKT
jgi:hypothetical protein